MVRDRFPECRLDRVIKLLHDTLVREESEMREASRGRRDGLLRDDDYLSDDSMSEVEKKKMQQEYARKFENS